MARKSKQCNRSIHPVLRRAYGNRACKLNDAILSLVDRCASSILLKCSKCFCGGTGCLLCCRADFILRPNDPITYRQLITCCVCAVPDDLLPSPDLNLVRRLSQREIVRKTMSWMLDESRSKYDLLCRSYDMKSGTSLSGEILSSSDWSLLLDRIGDSVMEFLLRNYYIFVPCSTSNKGFIQVTGTPLTKSLPNSTISNGQNKIIRDQIVKNTNSQFGHSKNSATCTEFTNKRKREEIAKKISTNLVPCTQLKASLTHDGENKRKRDEVAKFPDSVSNPSNNKSKKRLYSWQRRKQCKIDLGISIGTSENNLQNVKCGKPCFSCFMLHSTRKIEINYQIKRRYIFYNKSSSKFLLPKSHILNKLKPNDFGALSLMKGIFINHDNYSTFMQCANCGDSSLSRCNCLYHSFISLFKSIIRNAQRCRHRMLLHKHCLNLDQTLENSNLNSKLESSGSFSKHQQVVAFIFATLRNIIPQSLLGNKESWRALRKNIWNFVKLRRFENFSVENCLKGLKISHFEYLLKLEGSNCSCEIKKRLSGVKKSKLLRILLNNWVYWLFSHVISPIISSNFYVTERESKRHDVFYYKKPIWMNIVKATIANLKEKSFRVLEKSNLRKLFANRSFGFSKVRFSPKQNCLRALANLKKPSKLMVFSRKSKKKLVFTYQPVNSSLRELNVILKKIMVENANLLGSSVFDYNDAYRKLYNFILQVKSGSRIMPKVFVVVADVAKAFDSLDQDLLLRIMEGIIGKEEYIVGKYTQVINRNDKIGSIYKGSSLGCITSNSNSNSNLSVQLSSSSGVFIDQAYYQRIKKKPLQKLLFEHVKHNILHIGGQFYEQKIGIAQGSAISSLLCSFYLGHLEETLIWPFLKKIEQNSNEIPPHNLLMRFLDDFIFVSTSKNQALGFLERIKRGFRDYNCFMNTAKFGCNFEVSRGGFVNKRFVCENGESFLPWSGLLINCNTLEIQADYTRYWGINMRSTITVHKSEKPFDLLRKKLCDYMRPKCHAIFYDSNINSRTVVRLNLYQAFLLCAMKFHCYVSEMESPVQNPHKLLRIIRKTFSYMYNMIHKRMREMETNYGMHPVFGLKKIESVWLGISAYIRVLRKKQSRYTELLCLLRGNLVNCDVSGLATSSQLFNVVRDCHSSMFWKIKF